MEKHPHKIQLAILARLREQSPARYGYLKPPRVEGNVFVYHLRSLINQGIIEKVPEGYALTTEGHNYVDSLRSDGLGIRIQPRIVTLIALESPRGAYLLYKREQEPYRGLIGFPYGKVHIGEKIAQSAARECVDRVGFEVPLVHAGDVYVGVRKHVSRRHIEDGELLMHTLFHVFTGSIVEEQLVTKENLFWRTPAEVTPGEQIPGFREITHMLEDWKRGIAQPARFFGEFWLDV